MTRSEILGQALHRAEGYLRQQDTPAAFAAFVSELKAHEETKSHPSIEIGFMMIMGGQFADVKDMRKFLHGFH